VGETDQQHQRPANHKARLTGCYHFKLGWPGGKEHTTLNMGEKGNQRGGEETGTEKSVKKEDKDATPVLVWEPLRYIRTDGLMRGWEESHEIQGTQGREGTRGSVTINRTITIPQHRLGNQPIIFLDRQTIRRGVNTPPPNSLRHDLTATNGMKKKDRERSGSGLWKKKRLG